MEIMPFMVPISAILGGFAVGIVAMILKQRDREHRHRERMFLAEKGMEIPPDLYDVRDPKAPSEFRAARAWLMVLGAILIFVGIGVMIGVSVASGWHDGVHGVIPFMIGIGFLVSERLIAKFVVKPRVE